MCVLNLFCFFFLSFFKVYFEKIFFYFIKARKNNFNGPQLGPKMADENKREFTEQQLRGGESTLGLQAGYNKGANQAGIAFGMTRHM